MTRIAWVCLFAGLLAVGVAIWNRVQADKAREAAEEAIAIAEQAIAAAQLAGRVAEAERGARAWCMARGRPILGFQIQYADGKPARVAVMCSQELSS